MYDVYRRSVYTVHKGVVFLFSFNKPIDVIFKPPAYDGLPPNADWSVMIFQIDPFFRSSGKMLKKVDESKQQL